MNAPSLFISLTFFIVAALAPARAAGPAVRIIPDVAFLAADRAEKLDLYLPGERVKGERAPAVVWIHGGGFLGGTKNEARAKSICTTLAQAGYIATSIDYKLGDRAWPQNLRDCKDAVRFLRARTADYAIDPGRIAVAGGSAGGTLALLVAFTSGRMELEPEDQYPGISSGVRCVIDMYGITNLLTRQVTDSQGRPTGRQSGPPNRAFGATSTDDPVLRAASPVTYVAKDSPPVLILHGRADTTVDHAQSEELAGALKQSNVEHELIFLDGIGHTFDFETWKKKPLPRDLRPVVLEFLAQHMK